MTKRANGDGTKIETWGDGYRQRFTVGGKSKAIYGKTHKEIRQKKEKLMTDVREGRITIGSEQKLSDYLTQWLKGKRDSLRPKTVESYDLAIRRAAPHIGRITLGELKPAHIRECYTHLLDAGLIGKPLAKRSVQQVHAVLHEALKQAVMDETMMRNPCDAVSSPKPERKEMHVLSLEQAQTLFEHTTDDRLHALWVLLILTGMRIGEATGLRWDDIDLAARTVMIQRSMGRVRGQGLQFGPVKTHRSNRRIDLPQLAVDALRGHHDRQRLEERARACESEGLVFINNDGGRLDAGNVRESLRYRLKKAGLPDVRTHDLRHTAASIHLRDHQHPKVVQELLGHSTFSLTMNTYSHLMPSMTRDAADRMDSLFRCSEAVE